MSRGLVWMALAGVPAGCVTDGAVAQQTVTLESQLDAAAPHAKTCQPRADALARAEIAFARYESDQGQSLRAAEHLSEAQRWTALAAQAKAGCTPAVAIADMDGDGILDADDRCPIAPEDVDGDRDTDGCPDVVADGDGDGVPDTEDACLAEREDRDGHLDADGCPDPDNDGDGIGDDVDQCPNAPEDIDGVSDIDGCPDPDTPPLPAPQPPKAPPP